MALAPPLESGETIATGEEVVVVIEVGMPVVGAMEGLPGETDGPAIVDTVMVGVSVVGLSTVEPAVGPIFPTAVGAKLVGAGVVGLAVGDPAVTVGTAVAGIMDVGLKVLVEAGMGDGFPRDTVGPAVDGASVVGAAVVGIAVGDPAVTVGPAVAADSKVVGAAEVGLPNEPPEETVGPALVGFRTEGAPIVGKALGEPMETVGSAVPSAADNGLTDRLSEGTVVDPAATVGSAVVSIMGVGIRVLGAAKVGLADGLPGDTVGLTVVGVRLVGASVVVCAMNGELKVLGGAEVGLGD